VSYWPYAHDRFEDEIFTKNAQEWDKVLQRRVNPDMAWFRDMSMDEQVELIEKTGEATIRAHTNRERKDQVERRTEGERLIAEDERLIHENEKNIAIEGSKQPRGPKKKKM
jgi:hypothetical protein